MLDHASEVKRKTYRESLENNRETILLSKELVTIHTSVPVHWICHAMQTQLPDAQACRDLFSELEFTSLLKELGAVQQETWRIRAAADDAVRSRSRADRD